MDLEQITTDEDFITFLRQLSSQAEDSASTLEGYLPSRGACSTHPAAPTTDLAPAGTDLGR
jgi:hypothetical protein